MTTRKPVFNQVNVIVADMAAAVDFYGRLGVTLKDMPQEWSKHHRAVDSHSDVSLEFDSVQFAGEFNRGARGRGPQVMLSFGFESRHDVDAAYEDLVAAGYLGQQEPYDAFWGSRYAIIEDPDGHAIGLMSPVDEEHRTSVDAPSS
jgi:uncharacterized glyoxalase superfamily protein PhnB